MQLLSRKMEAMWSKEGRKQKIRKLFQITISDTEELVFVSYFLFCNDFKLTEELPR